MVSSLCEPICVYWMIWILSWFVKRCNLYVVGCRLQHQQWFSSEAGSMDACRSTTEFICRLYRSLKEDSHNMGESRFSGLPRAWTGFAHSKKISLEIGDLRRMYPHGWKGQASLASALFSSLSVLKPLAHQSVDVPIGRSTFLENGGWQYA